MSGMSANTGMVEDTIALFQDIIQPVAESSSVEALVRLTSRDVASRKNIFCRLKVGIIIRSGWLEEE